MLFFLGIESLGNTPCSANLDTTAKDSAHHPCRESPSLPKPTPPHSCPSPPPSSAGWGEGEARASREQKKAVDRDDRSVPQTGTKGQVQAPAVRQKGPGRGRAWAADRGGMGGRWQSLSLTKLLLRASCQASPHSWASLTDVAPPTFSKNPVKSA